MDQVLLDHALQVAVHQVHMFAHEGIIVTRQVAKEVPSPLLHDCPRMPGTFTPQLFPPILNRWAHYSF